MCDVQYFTAVNCEPHSSKRSLVLSRNKTVSYITVRLGSRNVNDGGSLYSVKSYHIHPKYNQTTSQRDIALLKLGATVKYSASISSIALVKPGYGMEEGTRCLIPRFARNTSDIRAKLWNREKCQNAFPTSLNLTDDALCARIVPTSINGSELCSDVSKACCILHFPPLTTRALSVYLPTTAWFHAGQPAGMRR